MAAISKLILPNETRSRANFQRYLVKVREGNEETVHYFHDEKEVRQFHQENLDLNLFDTELGQELLPLGEAPVRTNGESQARQTGRAARIGCDRKNHCRTWLAKV